MFAFRRFGFFILMAFVTSLSACATGRTNLSETGAVDVLVENTPKVNIQGVTPSWQIRKRPPSMAKSAGWEPTIMLSQEGRSSPQQFFRIDRRTKPATRS